MKRLTADPSWTPSLKASHRQDEIEIWGDRSNLGYSYAYRNRFEVAIELVTKATPPPARVLDVAAGLGNFTLRLAEQGYRVVWNDLRGDMAEYVRLKHERGCVEYCPGNVFDLPSRGIGNFDVVLATEVIEHVAHPDEFLGLLASLLKQNGTIVLTTPNGAYFRNRLPRFSDCPDPSIYEGVQFKPDSDGHIFLLYPEELATLGSKCGLKVSELLLFTNPLTNGHLNTYRLLPFLPERMVAWNEAFTRKFQGRIGRLLNLQLAASLRKGL